MVFEERGVLLFVQTVTDRNLVLTLEVSIGIESQYRQRVIVTHAVQDVTEHGLGLVLFPEWYSLDAMGRMQFYDDNTRSWWTPVTGGSNIPAVNDLVQPFGLAFGSSALHGPVQVGSAYEITYASGTSVVRAPQGAATLTAVLTDKAVAPVGSAAAEQGHKHTVMALFQHGSGRLAVYGDASCVDANHAVSNCHGMVVDMLRWVASDVKPAWHGALTELKEALGGGGKALPKRPEPDHLWLASYVLNNPADCHLNSAEGFRRSLLSVRMFLCVFVTTKGSSLS
jgi:membrane-bound transcription factor site-1 protease